MNLNHLALIFVPIVASGLNVGLSPNKENLCPLTRFTHSSMFGLFTVLFSMIELFFNSNFKYEINDETTITGIYLLIFSLLAAIVLISINIVIINQLSNKIVRRLFSLIIFILSIVLTFFIIYHETFLNNGH